MSVSLRRKGCRNVVDVAAAVVVVNDCAHRHMIGDQRQVQHRGYVRIGIPMRRDSIAGLDVALGDIKLGLVRDVPDCARLGACAEQRALRSLEDLDAIQVSGIDIEVAIG